MAKGGSTAPQTQTTTYQLSPEQRELMNLAMPGIREFAASTPQRYQGSTIAGFDPLQVAGQEAVIGAAPRIGELAQNAANTSNFWLSDAPWLAENNVGLRSAIDAATRPIQQNLMESTLPSIRGGAQTAGGFGGSRQGIAEGLASGRASQAIGDTGAKLAQDAYSTNVEAQMKAMGLLPQTQAAQSAEGLALSGVGDVRQAMAQALLGEQVNNFNWDQMAPFLQSKEIMSLLSGIPGGSTVSTGSTPQGNPLMGALGGAAAGASLGSAIFPGIGTAVGGGLGALLSFL